MECPNLSLLNHKDETILMIAILEKFVGNNPLYCMNNLLHREYSKKVNSHIDERDFFLTPSQHLKLQLISYLGDNLSDDVDSYIESN